MQTMLASLLSFLFLLLSFSSSLVRCQVVVSPHFPSISPFLSSTPLPAHATDWLTFSWWLPLQSVEWLVAEYEAVSDPSSPRYLDFHTAEFITAKVNPSQADVVAPVMAFLTQGGIPSHNISQVNAQLLVTAQVHLLESLFGVTFQLYRHTNQSTVTALNGGLLRTSQSITIPASVAPHLVLLKGLNDLPAKFFQREARRARSLSSRSSPSPAINSSHHSFSPTSTTSQLTCSYSNVDFATPNFIAQQSGYLPATATVPAKQVKLAVIGGFYGAGDSASGRSRYEYYSPADLNAYAHNLAYSITTPSINPFFGNQDASGYSSLDSSEPTYEASLDIQQAFSYCPQCSIGLFPVSQAIAHADTSDSTFYLNLENAYNAILALNATAQPHIVSLSYGLGESYYTTAEINAVEGILLQLATAGVTNLVSSGDDGANSDASSCSSSTLAVEYPSSSRYVLSVGATEYFGGVTQGNHGCVFSSIGDVTGSNNLMCGTCPSGGTTGYSSCQTGTAGPQRAVKAYSSTDYDFTGFTSGGGFSKVLSQPSAQTAAVAAYFSTGCTSANSCSLPSTGYTSTNRAVPDVSFYGSNTAVGYELAFDFLIGTSVSAPAFAGVLANLVQYYQNATNTTTGLGDVKGMLYAAQAATVSANGRLQAFTDVSSGDNICPAANSAYTSCQYSGCTGYTAAPGWVSLYMHLSRT